MKIRVLGEHIQAGSCQSPQKCMIAMAIKDIDDAISYVAVRTNGITITIRNRHGDSIRQHWTVPLKAARAIIRFDAGKVIQPFAFETKIIDQKVIPAVTEEQRQENAKRTKSRRAKLARLGEPEPKYGRKSRIAGI